ncbi:hypothetical protein CYK59_03800 [Latilactobacillus curvatus]|uniref:hypothetical protein n=1 Tax=Latilactobacillus curvatus TaxID=28038 RepID=UPI000F7CFEEC|nr:hypothetical protein [Latilactobacillus curvatus]AZP96128.1 hypothetical protein CYK59_03800 [Latilactobacillus curvatus]
MDKEFYEAIIKTQQKTIEKLSETNQSLVKHLVINANQNKPVEGMILADYESENHKIIRNPY